MSLTSELFESLLICHLWILKFSIRESARVFKCLHVNILLKIHTFSTFTS